MCGCAYSLARVCVSVCVGLVDLFALEVVRILQAASVYPKYLPPPRVSLNASLALDR